MFLKITDHLFWKIKRIIYLLGNLSFKTNQTKKRIPASFPHFLHQPTESVKTNVSPEEQREWSAECRPTAILQVAAAAGCNHQLWVSFGGYGAAAAMPHNQDKYPGCATFCQVACAL